MAKASSKSDELEEYDVVVSECLWNLVLLCSSLFTLLLYNLLFAFQARLLDEIVKEDKENKKKKNDAGKWMLYIGILKFQN